MGNASRLEVVYKELGDEHFQLLQLIDRLRAHDSYERLLPLLDELRALLIVHFAREQLPDGFYDALGERAKGRREEIEALKSDHAKILSSLNALLEASKAPDAGIEGELLSRASRLIDQLQDHEHREHRFAVDVLGAQESSH